MKHTKVGRTISRLAVVAEDFSTYYIPGVTMIGPNQVNQIAELPEEYHVLDRDGQLIAKVDKNLPCLVDYTDVYEGVDPEWLNSNEVQQILVLFGNRLFKDYNVMATNTKGEPAYIRQVTDADLRNFEHDLMGEIEE